MITAPGGRPLSDPVNSEEKEKKMTILTAIHANCSGCGTCRLACAIANRREVNPTLAALCIDARFPEPGDYRIRLCDQCGACAAVCPAEAIGVDDGGVYRIDEAICTGCMECVEACPEGVIAVVRSTSIPIKCTGCLACVEVCPRDAIQTLPAAG